LTRTAENTFSKLTKAFTEAVIRQHVDPAKPIILQNDVSGFAIAGIFNLFDSSGILVMVNI
jgi:hypothetical protein